MNTADLMTRSLQAMPQGHTIAGILAAALRAADPAAAVHRALQRHGTTMRVAERQYDLAAYDRVVLLAIGKAGAPMAAAAADLLGDRLTAGVVVVKEGHRAGMPEDPRLTLIEAGHPQPDDRSVAGAAAIMHLLQTTTERDLVLVLLSGGGSALMTLPAPGITLADMQHLTRQLLACGASIGEINTLRKHLDILKGGGLARAAAPAAVVALVLSDVVGSPLDIIASGPTVADSSTFADAWGVLERYALVDAIPPAIRHRLEQGLAGAVAETLKPGAPQLAQVQNLVIASNREAAEGARDAAMAAGFDTLILTNHDQPGQALGMPDTDQPPGWWLGQLAAPVEGEARIAGTFLAATARALAHDAAGLSRPACLIVGGETTVTLRGSGRGGRNQELALAAVEPLAGLPEVLLVTLATDGGDGPTDAAGAVVHGATAGRAAELGLNPAAHLAHNDAYPFFDALGDLLRPGPTHTNVNDLALLFLF
ncbi:MAG TPA: DUF4147 domain-containing protein [Roseiflexaceae bacterium]|nr:DUF4147 domain-containing protein [Roseiflexaceae bacterium]HMP38820.1 DUF4147 domain-containing protein [Roseiflexaceae bacterium]